MWTWRSAANGLVKVIWTCQRAVPFARSRARVLQLIGPNRVGQLRTRITSPWTNQCLEAATVFWRNVLLFIGTPGWVLDDLRPRLEDIKIRPRPPPKAVLAMEPAKP